MMMPDRKVYVARALCVMVVIPMVFLAAYPLVYLMLPESFKRLADLLQDRDTAFNLLALSQGACTGALRSTRDS